MQNVVGKERHPLGNLQGRPARQSPRLPALAIQTAQPSPRRECRTGCVNSRSPHPSHGLLTHEHMRDVIATHDFRSPEGIQRALKGRFAETLPAMVDGKLETHLSYPKHQAGPKPTPNRRNGRYSQHVTTECGEVARSQLARRLRSGSGGKHKNPAVRHHFLEAKQGQQLAPGVNAPFRLRGLALVVALLQHVSQLPPRRVPES